MNKLRI